MAQAYRLDIRYIPTPGTGALNRVAHLTETLTAESFEVSDLSVFDVIDPASVEMGIGGLDGYSGMTGLRMSF